LRKNGLGGVDKLLIAGSGWDYDREGEAGREKAEMTREAYMKGAEKKAI
jgi:hypothetical protein